MKIIVTIRITFGFILNFLPLIKRKIRRKKSVIIVDNQAFLVCVRMRPIKIIIEEKPKIIF